MPKRPSGKIHLLLKIARGLKMSSEGRRLLQILQAAGRMNDLRETRYLECASAFWLYHKFQSLTPAYRFDVSIPTYMMQQPTYL